MKRTASILFGMLLLPSVAWAEPSFYRLLKKVLPLKPAVSSRAANDETCTNFAGRWKGTCTDTDGVTRDDEMNIKQNGCNDIELAEHLPNFRETRSWSNASADVSSSTTGQINWNPAKTQINYGIAGNLNYYGESSGLNFSIFGTISISSGQLQTTMEADFRMLNTGDKIPVVYDTCTYTRVTP